MDENRDPRNKKKRTIQPLWFSRLEVCEILGLCTTKIDAEVKSGRLISFKYGGSRKFHSRDVHAFSMKMRDEFREQEFDNEYGVIS